MRLLGFVLTCVGLLEGAGPRGTCPALCRCDGVGAQQSVDCVDAGLRSVPSELSSFTFSLDLSLNHLSVLLDNVFIGLHHLQELRLAGNSLSEIRRDAFSGLTALELLCAAFLQNLQNNDLRTVPSAALQNLGNLRSLHLDANSISCPPASSFKGLSSLRHLWLDDNHLTEVPVGALQPLTELRALTLALNRISSVPDRAFAALRRLLVLHLHDNCIQTMGRRSFTGLKELETLDLSSNRIRTFPEAIRSLISLRALNLQNNNIPVIPENAFTGNPSIQSINLQNNPLLTVGPQCLRLLPEIRIQGLELQQVSNQDHDTPRVSELSSHCHVFVLGVGSRSLKEPVDRSNLITWCLDLLQLFFIFSIIFNLLVLFSILLLPSSALTPRTSSHLPLVIFWFRLLAGLVGSRMVSSDWFRISGLETDPGQGLLLCSLCSEVCVFILMGSVVWGKTRTGCVVICSLVLTLVHTGEPSFWTPGFGLILFNTFWFLLIILTHLSHWHPRGLCDDPVPLTLLYLSISLLLIFSALSPDVSTCAALLVWSLTCCVDPLIYMVLSPVIRSRRTFRI